jgi:C4-dicarboxylate-specific signal transduction histidine kinase
MAERVLDAEVDAELLRRNRLGESHAALSDAFGCSKSLVQRRIARAKFAEHRLADEPKGARANDRAKPGSPSTADAEAAIQVRAEYERIVRESRDSRSVVAALKEL